MSDNGTVSRLPRCIEYDKEDLLRVFTMSMSTALWTPIPTTCTVTQSAYRLPSIEAQATDAMINPKGQSPFLVGAYLKTPCDGWTTDQISSYVPAGTAIPVWARQNVTVRNARGLSCHAQLTNPAHPAVPDLPNITATSPTSSLPFNAATGAGAIVVQQPSNVGAIAGGTVAGGFFGVLLIGTLVLWMLPRQRNIERHPHRQMSERSAFIPDSNSDVAHGYGHQPVL
ncbi:hypothetical protein C8Q80DRAFT_1119084 [Daedaleopsis nitida]|nr:hypothetical protein C8Q80DRAFT_1119084 [Daedaleopsis nitida]